MTREERVKKLRYLITCMKCEVSGKECDDNCPTQYDAGNMDEIIENLEEIAKALQQEPILDKVRAEIETEKNAGCHTWYAGGLNFAMSIIDKYMAERSGTDAKEKINPYKKCKTCGQDKASCCGCPEVLELERRIRKEHKEC